MNIANWRQIAELIGIGAIVASLIFVGLQIEQEQNIAIADTYGTFSESTTNLAELVERNVEIWKKGLDGDELSETETIIFSAIVEAVQTHFSHVHIRWRQIGPVDPSVAARKFAYALYIFPGLRNARDRQLAILESGNISLAGTFTSSGFENQVNQFLRVYDEEGEQIPEDQEYVFW